MFRLRLFSLFCAVTIVLAGGLILPGCGEQQPPWYDGIYDLSNVRVSEDLAPTLDLAIASLNDPLPRGKSVDDLAKYEDLIIRLKSPTGSTAAGDEVLPGMTLLPSASWVDGFLNDMADDDNDDGPNGNIKIEL